MTYNDLCQSSPKFTVYTPPFFCRRNKLLAKKMCFSSPTIFIINEAGEASGEAGEAGFFLRLCCHTNRAGVQMALSSVTPQVP